MQGSSASDPKPCNLTSAKPQKKDSYSTAYKLFTVDYLATELAPRGIRVNAVAPAIVETDAVRTLFGADAHNLVVSAASNNPSGRGVTDLDYTNLIRWLASPEAEFIQGQVIFVNGGANLSA